MRIRVLRHIQGVIIRGLTDTCQRPAYVVIYRPENLRLAEVRRIVRNELHCQLQLQLRYQ